VIREIGIKTLTELNVVVVVVVRTCSWIIIYYILYKYFQFCNC
jgi:hypothetical protein